MKKIRYIIVSLILIQSLACSDNYLDTLPSDQISEDVVVGTLDNLYISINGTHRAMVKQYLLSQSCGGEPSMCIYRDVMGEDLVHPNASNTWYLSALRWREHRNENSILNKFIFTLYYRLILNANIILANVDNVVITDQNKHNGVKGEALCFRAWSHFNLVQLYGSRYESDALNLQLGIPYRRKPTVEKMARNTVEDCYMYINNDLEEAIELLKNYQAVANTHFSLKVAYGIKARVALAQQNYTDAAKYAELAIEVAENENIKTRNELMIGNQLLSGFASILDDTDEAMWAANTQDDQSVFYYSFYAYMSWNYNSTPIKSAPRCINSKLYNEILSTDIRRQWWDPTGSATVPSSSYRKYKYQNRKFAARSTSSAVGDFAYMRLAEMYLMQAESLARNGSLAEAQRIFTKYALTRNPSYIPTSRTDADLVEEIMIHRRIELWGEGFRFTDLKRLNMTLDRKGANHDEATSLQMNVTSEDKLWQFMIPINELNANDLIIQNPI